MATNYYILLKTCISFVYPNIPLLFADDYEPITDYAEPDSQPRQNSAIHIRVVRTALFGVQ